MKGLHSYKVALEKNKPYVAMIFIQFVYAGMALFSKAAIAKGMNPYVFVVYRQAFGSLSLAPFAFFDSKKVAPLSFNLLSKIFLMSLVGDVLVTLSSNLYYVAINSTSATFAAASTNTIPGITFIMAVILRVERLSIKQMHGLAKVFGSIVGLSGAAKFAFVKGPAIGFMKWYPEPENQKHSQSVTAIHSNGECIRGSLMMISANTSWALWLILQGLILKSYPAKFRLIALKCSISCIQSAILAVAVERNPSAWKLGWDVHLISVAYCGIIVTGICYWLQAYTIEEKGPVFTAMFTPLSLIITAIFSALLWKETLYWGSVGGTILLVIGLYGVLWGKNRESTKDETSEDTATAEEHKIQIGVHYTAQH